MEIKKCPFCGKPVTWDITYLSERGIWHLSHACHHDGDDKELTSFISVYGKTKEEAIDRWNGRVGNE